VPAAHRYCDSVYARWNNVRLLCTTGRVLCAGTAVAVSMRRMLWTKMGDLLGVTNVFASHVGF